MSFFARMWTGGRARFCRPPRNAHLLDLELGTSRSVDQRGNKLPDEHMMDKDLWRRRDHKFAVGTIALMLFLLVAGFTSWMLNGNASTAAPSSSERAQ
jgi:hypothetical protein